MSGRLALVVIAALAAVVALVASVTGQPTASSTSPLVADVYPSSRPAGLMVTSGGWAYCEQMRPVARRTRHTLLCGRYARDGYLGPGLRAKRQLDWGNAAYLARLATAAARLHGRIGGDLILIGVSYSGFGVASLAAHHPELQADRLIVIDSYFDLVRRRRALPNAHETALEIDREAGTSNASLRRRSPSPDQLARLVRAGTRLTVVWTISDDERRRFAGVTCDREASAGTLSEIARRLEEPVPGWVTRGKHGRNLWRHGVAIVRGFNPGQKFLFFPDSVPDGSYCRS